MSNLFHEKTAESIRSELERLEVRHAELQTALRVVEGLAVDEEDLVTTVADNATTAVAAPQSGDPLVYPGVHIDFTGAGNLLERVIRIAEAVGNEPPLDSMEMAHCLIQRGASKADPHNLRSHITNALAGHVDFQKTGPGQYRYEPAGGVTLSSSGSTSNSS